MNSFVNFAVILALALAAAIATGLLSPHVAAIIGRRLAGLRWLTAPPWRDLVFPIIAVIYLIVFSALTVLQQVSFHGTGFDLAQYDQLLWNSLRGHLLENSLIPDAPFFLGKSFSPILLALVPVYAVWADPIVLVLIQTAAIVASAFPIYWLARQCLGNGMAIVFGLAFFLSPVVEFLNLTQFYEIVLATPLLTYAYFFLVRDRIKAFLVCLALALLVKEEIALITIAMGLYVLLFRRHRRFGVALTGLGAVATILLLQLVIPYFRDPRFGTGFYYFGSGTVGGAQTRYAYLGTSFGQVLATVLTRPDIMWQHLVLPDKIEFVLHQFVSLAFVPLVGFDLLLISLPTLGYTLLSDFGFQYSIQHAYTAPLIPVVYISGVIGAERLLRWGAANSPRWMVLRWPANWAHRPAVAALILVSSSTSYYLNSPGPLSSNFRPQPFTVDDHTALAYRLMQTIPDDATVAAQTEFVSHLSRRPQIYEFPAVPDYRQIDYLFADRTRFWYAFHKDSWNGFLATGYFEVVTEEDGYWILRRRSPAQAVTIHYGDRLTLVSYGSAVTETLRSGLEWRPIVEWRVEQSVGARYQMRVQVQDARGHVWAQEEREPQNGYAPTNQWQVGRAVGDQYTLKLPSTMPPGEYQMVIGVHTQEEEYLQAVDAQGQPVGQEPVVATFRVEKDHASWTASQLVIEQPLFVDMGEIRFLGYVPPRQTIAPGELFQLGLYWRARAKPRGDYIVAVQLRDPADHVLFEQSSLPAGDAYPTTQWEAGEVLLDWHDFALPSDLAVGEYRIFVALRDEATHQILGETMISPLIVER